MSTVSVQAPPTGSEGSRRLTRVLVRDMWASLAIVSMWLTVLFDALFGPDLVAASATSSTTIPSAVIVAFFAYLGTRVVARYGFERSHGA